MLLLLLMIMFVLCIDLQGGEQAGMVVPGSLMFYCGLFIYLFFLALCGAISPSCLGTVNFSHMIGSVGT